jgi:hypothetical protein
MYSGKIAVPPGGGGIRKIITIMYLRVINHTILHTVYKYGTKKQQ